MITFLLGGGSVESVDGQTGVVVTNAVKTIPQTLTESQKTQAQTNIGVKDVVENITWDTNKNAQFPANISLKNIIGSESAYFKNLYVTSDGGTTSGVDIYGANGNIVSKGTVTANKFVGDGSGLTNLPISDESTVVVHLTYDESGSMIPDKTFAELYAALNNGQAVFLQEPPKSTYYTLDWYSNSSIQFHNTQLITYQGGHQVSDSYYTIDSSDQVTSTVNQAFIPTSVADLIYPVGSIYMSVNRTSPATLFGGTWAQLKDRFLLGAGDTYTAGATDGEATHTLSIEEMPNHWHKLPLTYSGSDSYNPGTSQVDKSLTAAGNYVTTGTASAGASQPHNNMPPYLAVYMWKRTA